MDKWTKEEREKHLLRIKSYEIINKIDPKVYNEMANKKLDELLLETRLLRGY